MSQESTPTVGLSYIPVLSYIVSNNFACMQYWCIIFLQKQISSLSVLWFLKDSYSDHWIFKYRLGIWTLNLWRHQCKVECHRPLSQCNNQEKLVQINIYILSISKGRHITAATLRKPTCGSWALQVFLLNYWKCITDSGVKM